MCKMKGYLIFTILVLTIFTSTLAFATTITAFNMTMPDGTVINNVGNLDLAPGSGLSVNGNFFGPGGAGSPIQFLYQAFTAAIQDPAFTDLTPALLRAPFAAGGYEFTAVSRLWETAVGLGSNVTIFTLADDPTGTQPNVVELWADSTALGGSQANVIAGTGFNDGVLALKAVPTSLSAVYFLNDTNGNGVLDNQDTGVGSVDVRAKVTYVNPAFFDFSTFPVNSSITIHFIGTLNTPPEGVDTQHMWNGTVPNYFTPLVSGTTPLNTEDILLKVDGTVHFTPAHISCVKECTPSSAPGQPIGISAFVTNDGSETLNNVTCTDDPDATLTGVPVASLGLGASIQVTGSYTPTTNPSTDTLTCSGTGAASGQVVTTTCSATCGVNVGQCRMTGGSETLIEDPTFGATYVWLPGTYALDSNGSVLITTGGQIGAPMASTAGPSFGEWEHQQHCSKKTGCSGAAFGFDFKAGTASGKAKDTTIINSVLCGDAGWCTQARCAPFKQIFWDGIGLVKNLWGSSNPFTACGGEGSLHYFKAHVGDFGEPGSNAVTNKKCGKCDWKSGGVDIANIKLLVDPPVPDPKFEDKGGQVCPCGCGDWYEINIYCRSNKDADGNPQDPGAIIYKFASFIDTGNFQLHPPVGEHCE